MNEKDIENAFLNFYLNLYGDHIDEYIQQASTNAGIIDLLFFNKTWGNLIVVEVKKGKAPSGVLSQLYGYFWYLQSLLSENIYYKDTPRDDIVGKIYGIIVAEDLDYITKRAIGYSHEIVFYKYTSINDKLQFNIYSSNVIRDDEDWNQYLSKLFPNIHGNKKLSHLIETVNNRSKTNYQETELCKVNHSGGTYDPILFDDLKGNSNVIFENTKGRR